MRIIYSSKRELYYAKAMKLYFEKGMRGTNICKVLPISRSLLCRWIAIFAEENPLVASMKRVKAITKAPDLSPENQQEDLLRDIQALQAELKKLRAELLYCSCN